MRTALTRVIGIKPENCIQAVKKLASSYLQITRRSGVIATISQDDPLLQQFTIYSVLAEP